jgi:3-oxoacyl-[acyl-carrier-protein] synthase-3
VPAAIAQVLDRSGRTMEDHDLFVFHQANAFMLERLRQKLAIPADRFVVHMEDWRQHRFLHHSHRPGALLNEGAPPRRVLLVGFGVGYSWAATSVVL